MDDAISTCQRAFCFFLPRSRVALNLPLRPASINTAKVRSDVRCAKDRDDAGAAIIKGKNDKPIYRTKVAIAVATSLVAALTASKSDHTVTVDRFMHESSHCRI